MDLRENKINEVVNAYFDLEDDIGYYYYYDRQVGRVISIDEEYIIEGSELEDGDEEEMALADDILSDVEDRFLQIEAISSEDYLSIELQFIDENHPELKEEIQKIFHKKDFEDKYFDILGEKGLMNEYEVYEKEEIYAMAERFLEKNHVLEKKADIQSLRTLYETACQFATMEVWKVFKDTDIIHLKLKDQGEDVYFSIMGNANKTYGVSIYFGASGLNEISLLARSEEYGIDGLFAMSLQDNYTIYFDKPEDMSEEDRAYDDSLEYKHVGNMIPQIYESSSGYFLSSDLDDTDCKLITMLLEILMAGLSPKILNDRHLKNKGVYIEANDDEVKVKLKDKIILSYIPDFELESERGEEKIQVFPDKTYEFSLKVMDKPMMTEDNVTPQWIYTLLIYNRTDDHFVNVFERTNVTNLGLSALQFDLMREIEDNGIGGNIIVNDPIMEAMVEPYSDLCSITIGELSENMRMMLDKIQGLADEPNEIN